jgi:hypothetical protein
LTDEKLKIVTTTTIKPKPNVGYYIGINEEGFLFIKEGNKKGRHSRKAPVAMEPPEPEVKEDVLC